MTDVASPWTLAAEPPTGELPPPAAADSPGSAADVLPPLHPLSPLPPLPSEPPTGPLPAPAAPSYDPADIPTEPSLTAPPQPPRATPPTGEAAFGGPALDDPPRPPRRLPRGAVSALAAAAIALAAGGVGGAIGVRTANDANDNASAGSTNRPVTSAARNSGSSTIAGSSLSVKDILAKVEPAVVDIQARGARGQGQGTGVVVNAAEGLILTNAHVVAGSTQITVTAPTDKQARSATLVGADDGNDIAVLRVEPVNLVEAELGSSADTAVGDDVVAIGNALGLRGDPSVTRGIVSGKGRSVGPLSGMLQTDAAINPGNSGGPLVNASGQVIGINTAVAGAAQNIGFAIPIDTARSIIDRLVAGQSAAPLAFLGVTTGDAADGSPGAVVADISPGSPADTAGLRVGDRVVSVNDIAVPGSAELRGIVQTFKPDETVRLTIVRDGDERTIEVKLGKRP